MRIGVDFDNTIICYDTVFNKVAREAGHVPADLPPGKNRVRDHLRAAGREDDWTRLQGEVYGAHLSRAPVFPGGLDFFAFCRKAQIPVFIVSHKTRHPYLGVKHDLHRAARNWLHEMGFFSDTGHSLPEDRVFFELSKEDKLARIAALNCTHFIDDLPEFLAEPGFPAATHALLFDPWDRHGGEGRFNRFLSWNEIRNYFAAFAGGRVHG